MNKHLLGLALIATILNGCGKNKDSDGTGTTATGTGTTAAGGSPTQPTASGDVASKDPKALCESLVPAKFRGTGLDVQTMLPGVVMCTFKQGDAMKSVVSLDCRRGRNEAAFKREHKDPNPLPQVVGRATSGTKQSSDFLDGQADCIVGVSLLGDDPDTTELAKSVEAALTKDNAPSPPARKPGDPDLVCDKLVAADLKDKFGIGELEKEDYNVEKSVECMYAGKVDPDAYKVGLNYDCRVHFGADELKQFADAMRKGGKDPKELSIGKGGLAWADGALFVDGDVPCNVTITWISIQKGAPPPNLAAFATELEKAFTPAAAGL